MDRIYKKIKNMIQQIKNGNINGLNGCVDLNKPIDVVCHSMGYAHALGAMKVLQDIGLKIGAFYCLAPEGVQFTEKVAGCMEVLNKIETKVQFGSDENKDPIFKQDLIAPQYPVPGATRHYHDLNNLDYRNALWQAHMLDPIFKKEFGADEKAPEKDIFSKEIKSRK